MLLQLQTLAQQIQRLLLTTMQFMTEGRKLELFMDNDTVSCDLIKGTILYEKEGRAISFSNDRDTWQTSELMYFLGLIEKRKFGVQNIETAKNVLKIAGGMTK